MRIATFAIDITPPVGHPLAYGVNKRIYGRQWLRGVVCDDGQQRVVMAAADVIALGATAHRCWRAAIAKQAICPVANVILHAVHQHDALIFLSEADDERRAVGWNDGADPRWYQRLARVIGDGMRSQLSSEVWREAQVGSAEARVDGVASNRRLLGENGRIRATRWSRCAIPAVKQEPVGLIDPLLRTIAFRDTTGKVLASCHFYGSHPQVASGREMAGPDLPGEALAQLSRQREGFHIWFTGAAGDITAGKYTFTDPEKSLAVLGMRLATAMARNLDHLDDHGRGSVTLCRKRAHLALQFPGGLKGLRQRLKTNTNPANFFPALHLALWRRRAEWGRPWLTRLSLAPGVHVLSLPSEVVIHYQLFAQAQVPEQFVACATMGEYLHGYIPTDAMFAQGGYEPEVSPCAPGVQAGLEAGIAAILRQ